MDDLLKFLLRSISEEDIEFDKEENRGITNYTIHPPQKRAGFIIGKGGKIIKSITRIIKIKATIKGEKVTVRVEPKT